MNTARGDFPERMTAQYADRLLELLLSRGNRPPRSYGFEYEFLPHRILFPEDMDLLRAFLLDRGYVASGAGFTMGRRQVAFEPGGQIEYLSPPIRAADRRMLEEVLAWISSMNEDIEKTTGIRYLGTDFIPGRHGAPLLLSSSRYSLMHERFMSVDDRGPDMMKGTAAIHMHAAITSPEDLESLYAEFCRMASGETLGMSSARREVWSGTDSCRCGLPSGRRPRDAGSIIRCIVEQAMKAVEFTSGRVFGTVPGWDFDDFLDHLTTMFTDVRVNVKGGTLELRTPDSRPLSEFREAWEEFVERCESVS
ncbi:MAG: hypothetical protein AVO35_07780 [Candidatus Aegiribacteria sp. MLS_C]|nr:MAG: hypothetical protein AVO35_07780 [Candidatus Aegiribacteria sp. MLS_C]